MAALRVRRRSFERRYRGQTKELLKLSRNLPDRPTPDDVHDLRVAVRRIQMMRRLLPKEVRGSEEWRRFDLTLKSAVKATSQLRDSDTLLETLGTHKTNLPQGILVNLENQRSDMAVRARDATDLVVGTLVPDLDPLRIRGKKISRRFRRRVQRQGQVVGGLLPTVLRDESKVAELHTLRKEVKKLRYLMELADEGPAELSIMTSWQESLGAIHDLDVAASYLRGLNGLAPESAVRDLLRLRHVLYVRFATEYTKDSMGTLTNSRIITRRPIASSN